MDDSPVLQAICICEARVTTLDSEGIDGIFESEGQIKELLLIIASFDQSRAADPGISNDH